MSTAPLTVKALQSHIRHAVLHRKSITITDSEVRGLSARIAPTGRVTWVASKSFGRGRGTLPTRSENASVGAETTMTFVRTVRSATKRRQHWRNAHRQRARREREKAESSGPAWSEYGGKLARGRYA